MHPAAKAQSLQRVGFLALVPALLRKHHQKPDSVLLAAGLDPDALTDPENTIRYASMGFLLQVAADRANCPHFGLEVGAVIRTAVLGVVGELMRNAPTVGAAICDFCEHQHRNAQGAMAYLTESSGQAFWGYAVYEPNVPGNSIICDAAAMAACNLVRELAGEQSTPIVEVLLMRSKPANPQLYCDAFQANVHFDAEQTGIRLAGSTLNQRIPGANAMLRASLQERVNQTWHAGEPELTVLVRRALRVGLIRHQTSAIEIAKRLGMGRRTVQRRLNKAGLPFQQLLDETRCDFAQQLLRGTGLSVGEISAIVGYNHPSIFAHAFAGWAGLTPSKWRMERMDPQPIPVAR